MFEACRFIKPDRKFEMGFTEKNYAPMFRRKFHVSSTEGAVLSVCGLGFAHYYINGKRVTEDLFIAPVSDYTKTLWYTRYDVSHLLREGENVIAVWCGNGWYNEDFKTAWDYDQASWRDLPKVILQLDIDGQTVLGSDANFKFRPESAVWFNALRSGEYFDATKYDADWASLDFDDTDWENAILDDTPPTGVFRECVCEPIREFKEYKTQKVYQRGDACIFDIGQNISGYIRIKVKGQKGQALTIRYAEQIHEDLTLNMNGMDIPHFYPESKCQTDRLILSGEEIEWSPRFVYHGFRYIEIEGLTSADEAAVSGIFVHQAVERQGEFECSNLTLNALFKAGVYSVWSNMFYSLTDCPTREKLGWANDAQGTCDQILTNFKAEKFFRKWLTDMYDAMREDGAMPGIIPTSGWGFEWGNGPVSDGVLFEVPYRLYRHTGDGDPLIESPPYFKRYLAYLDARRDENGFVDFGLPDWAAYGLDQKNPKVPRALINGVLEYHFCNVAALAQKLAGEETTFAESARALGQKITEMYIKDGRCTVDEQTAVAMLIYFDLGEREPLAKQLKGLIEKHDFHHDCGMVGIRRLYLALNKCGLQEYAYRILVNRGCPSYVDWLDDGATTLYEHWAIPRISSRNHHMNSDFMSWLMKTVLGITGDFSQTQIDPYFFKDLKWAKGRCGDIGVSWEKIDGKVKLCIDVPTTRRVYYKGELLSAGSHGFEETYYD